MRLMKTCMAEMSGNHLLVIDSAIYRTYMLIKINSAAETFISEQNPLANDSVRSTLP